MISSAGKHLECLDLHKFLKMEEKRPKGQCPVCNKLSEFRRLGVCEFTSKFLADNENCEGYRITSENIEPLSEVRSDGVSPSISTLP